MSLRSLAVLPAAFHASPHKRADRAAPEMIAIWFAGWISGMIASLQPDTDIHKLLRNGNRIQIRISETLFSIFRGIIHRILASGGSSGTRPPI